jgi:hypothetical protein
VFHHAARAITPALPVGRCGGGARSSWGRCGAAHRDGGSKLLTTKPSLRSDRARRFLGGVQFGGDGTFVVFPRTALVRRRSGADQLLQLFRLAQDQYGVANTDDSWTCRVRRPLRAHAAPRLLDAGMRADQFGLSPRNLSRRLAREGASVSSLIDESCLTARSRCCAAREPLRRRWQRRSNTPSSARSFAPFAAGPVASRPTLTGVVNAPNAHSCKLLLNLSGSERLY